MGTKHHTKPKQMKFVIQTRSASRRGDREWQSRPEVYKSLAWAERCALSILRRNPELLPAKRLAVQILAFWPPSNKSLLEPR